MFEPPLFLHFYVPFLECGGHTLNEHLSNVPFYVILHIISLMNDWGSEFGVFFTDFFCYKVFIRFWRNGCIVKAHVEMNAFINIWVC